MDFIITLRSIKFCLFIVLRFDIATAVKMMMLVFWVATPCGLAGEYHGPSVLKMNAVC
jgi:hypothetical protein